MAEYWTWSQIKTKVKDDCDLQSETFISDSELLALANEGIDDIERAVHTLQEDYFLSSSTLSLVSGTSDYSLPTDIYAMKIRGIIYKNGTEVFPIKRIREWHKFEDFALDNTLGNTKAMYRYFVKNTTAGAPKIVISPTPAESGSFCTVWYIRNANKLVDNSSVCDIPEAINYLVQFLKTKVYEKEHNPMIQKAMADLEAERTKMVSSLAEKTPDNDTEAQPDFTYYNEMVGIYG